MAGSFLLGASIILCIFLLDRQGTLNYISQYQIEYPNLELDSPVRRFLWMVTGSQYGAASGVFGGFISFDTPANMLRILAAAILDNGFLLLCGVAGLYVPAPGGRIENGFTNLRCFFATTLVAMVLYLSTYKQFFQPIFFIVVYVIFAFGTARLIDYLRRYKVQRAVLFVLLAALSLGMIKANYSRIDKSNSSDFEQRSRALLEAVEPDAVLLATWHNATLLWFHQRVHDLKPQVQVISADPENWLRIAAAHIQRPLYFEKVPPGARRSRFVQFHGFHKLRAPSLPAPRGAP
jgi:hypothetical protein